MIGVLGMFIIGFLLLMFMRQVNGPLYPMVFTIMFLWLLVYVWTMKWRPFVVKLEAIFESVPYSKPLLLTATILVISDLLEALFSQFDMESYGQLLKVAVQLTIILLWLPEIERLLNQFMQIAVKFGL